MNFFSVCDESCRSRLTLPAVSSRKWDDFNSMFWFCSICPHVSILFTIILLCCFLGFDASIPHIKNVRTGYSCNQTDQGRPGRRQHIGRHKIDERSHIPTIFGIWSGPLYLERGKLFLLSRLPGGVVWRSGESPWVTHSINLLLRCMSQQNPVYCGSIWLIVWLATFLWWIFHLIILPFFLLGFQTDDGQFDWVLRLIVHPRPDRPGDELCRDSVQIFLHLHTAPRETAHLKCQFVFVRHSGTSNQIIFIVRLKIMIQDWKFVKDFLFKLRSLGRSLVLL